MVRKLNDGRPFRIVKNVHQPAELIDRAAAADITLDVHETDTFFQFGVATAQ